jgi:hypothetical protein
MKALAAVVAVFASLALAVPLPAQTPAQLKSDLRSKETAAKQDPEALFKVAQWAAEKGLAAEAKRLYQAVLKIQPTHEGANLGVGNELVDGKWLPAKEAAAARKKAMEAEFKSKGMVEIGGVFVEKEHVADAKKGIYHYEGQTVSKEELKALREGMVRHPITETLIPAADLDKAKNRMYPIGSEQRWVDEKEAEKYHSDPDKPWVFRTTYCTLLSTLPINILEKARTFADQGYETVRPILGVTDPTPADRPVIFVAATEEEYGAMGRAIGDETSAYGAFMATESKTVSVPYQGDVRPAICLWETKNGLGEYYLRHAVGLAYLEGLCVDAGADVPLWFLHGVGSFASRFTNHALAGFFGEQQMQRGGVKELKIWFSSFTINPDLSPQEISGNVFLAGLMISFAAEGGDKKVTDAMLEVTKGFTNGKGRSIDKGIEKLQKLIISKEAEVKSFLQKLVAEKNR